MAISSIGSAPVTPPPAQAPAPKVNDHDADDGVSSAPPAQAAAAPGTGVVVNKKA